MSYILLEVAKQVTCKVFEAREIEDTPKRLGLLAGFVNRAGFTDSR
jgi:hypothetical protein